MSVELPRVQWAGRRGSMFSPLRAFCLDCKWTCGGFEPMVRKSAAKHAMLRVPPPYHEAPITRPRNPQ